MSTDPPRPPWTPSGVVTLTTDFGWRDPYVGVMKGVLLSENRALQVVDLTHGVPPQDLRAAAFYLDGSWRYFPAGTVHVAVVDPGVGSERKILVARREGHVFLAPDNGLLTPILEGADRDVWSLDVERFSLPKLGTTFQGRDVFSPAAAKIASGQDPASVGPALEGWVEAELLPEPDRRGAEVEGFVLLVDRFGNLVTNVRPADLEGRLTDWEVVVAGRSIEVRDLYADARVGEPLALVDSYGYLEIALRDGDASDELGVEAGASVLFRAAR